MRNFLEKLDGLADIETEKNSVRRFERAAFALLVLMFVAAPHSIAATNIFWLTGMFVWFVRWLFLKPRAPLVRTPLDVPLWAFFGWSLVSSIFSYDPLTSLDKLRLNVALFLIFYFVVNVARTKRAVVFLAFVMIASAMVAAVWTPIERVIGRGVQIAGVSKESLLTKVELRDGDALLKANGVKIRTPDDLTAEIERGAATKIYVYRPDYYLTVEVKKEDLPAGETATQRLGIADWKPSRNWRSAGFYGHYTTFAEVLQLVASLAFGLFIASLTRKKETTRQPDDATMSEENTTARSGTSFFFSSSFSLVVILSFFSLALLLTVTRASQLGFLISAATIVLLVGSRKMFLILTAAVLPIALIGLVFLQQSREVGFFDAEDGSTRWRQTVYREGLDLWTQNPRHFILGVGMDSIKKYAKEWHLFDDGRLPMGHFHSTPLQLLVERGLPALLLWLWVLWRYGRTLWRNFKLFDWRERGIVLGCFGGMVGFSVGGIVHYNLGDAEVAMAFFMLMGLSVSLAITNYKLSIKNDKDVFSS